MAESVPNRTTLVRMAELGTSPWIDNITRDWFGNGKLAELVSQGIVGLTSNPAIFAAAIASTELYDAQIKQLSEQGMTSRSIALELAKSDISQAAQVLAPVFEATGHKDGWASIEVDPDLAYQAQETMSAVRAMRKAIAEPNVMIKIPATPDGLGPIEEAISEGVSVNVTLIFSIERYREVFAAFLRGATRFLEGGGDPSRLGSVASFFVSRLDTAIDPLLVQAGRGDLAGAAAVAQAKLAYVAFREMAAMPEATEAFARGLRPQRPLFASTSTKNPTYPKLLYVENLLGPDTVNTMPLATVEEMLASGDPRRQTVTESVTEARRLIEEQLPAAGVDLSAVTSELEVAGVEAFSKSWAGLMSEIEKKAGARS
ncbi:MAG: transaldolase [Nitrospiraceae bacterium]|nr:transaldolase [Nitrospiraceae bacterium]